MLKQLIVAETIARKRPHLVLFPDDIVGKSDFLNPQSHSGAAAIIEDGDLVGILTERDLLKRVLAKGLDPQKTKVRDVMTPNPVTVDADAPLKDTLNILVESGFRYLPVIKNKVFIGLIDVRDLYMEIQTLMKETISKERNLFASMMAEPYGMDTFSVNMDPI